jgi:hypothetical protein
MDTSDMGDTADEDQVNDINLGRMSMHARPNQGDMIPVIRIAQRYNDFRRNSSARFFFSMRNSKHKKEVKIQGYLIHTTNNDDMVTSIRS